MSNQNNYTQNTQQSSDTLRQGTEENGNIGNGAQWPPLDLYQQIDALISSNVQNTQH